MNDTRRFERLLYAFERWGTVPRVHPHFAIHAQANHRWSTTDPPLAQLPAHLETLFCPDPEWPWIGWDWDTQELRLLAAIAGDRPLLDAFREGHDVHTLTTCEIFNLRYPDDRTDPHTSPVNEAWRKETAWQGKKDPRRSFAKRFVYSLNYGKKPKNAIHIPGAKALGFGGAALEAAAARFLRAHPALAAWRAVQRERCLRMRVATDFMGGRRVFGEVSGEDLVRAAYDFPMQAGGVRILNRTLIELYHTFVKTVQLKYQQHDSVWLAVHESIWGKDTWKTIVEIVTKPRPVGSVEIDFPATFYVWEPGGEKTKLVLA